MQVDLRNFLRKKLHRLSLALGGGNNRIVNINLTYRVTPIRSVLIPIPFHQTFKVATAASDEVVDCPKDTVLPDICKSNSLGSWNRMLEVTCNDRLGKKVRVKCNHDDTIGDLKKLIAAQTGTRWEKIVLKKWYTIFKDHIMLQDYEIHDGMNLELYYQ